MSPRRHRGFRLQRSVPQLRRARPSLSRCSYVPLHLFDQDFAFARSIKSARPDCPRRLPSYLEPACFARRPKAMHTTESPACLDSRAPFRLLPTAACVSRSTVSFGLGPSFESALQRTQIDEPRCIGPTSATHHSKNEHPYFAGSRGCQPILLSAQPRGNERFTTPESLWRVMRKTILGRCLPRESCMTSLWPLCRLPPVRS